MFVALLPAWLIMPFLPADQPLWQHLLWVLAGGLAWNAVLVGALVLHRRHKRRFKS
jgi:hypothetical protein